MRERLTVHPRAPNAANFQIDVEAARTFDGALLLAYKVSGAAGDIRIPPQADPVRRNELWQRTCFEAFIREPGADAYLEINLSPSGEWAAFAFDAYRAGMRIETSILKPRIETRLTEGLFELRAAIDLAWVLSGNKLWLVGLSAVIEELSGVKSYWALAHPPGGKPDFHHSKGFALELG